MKTVENVVVNSIWSGESVRSMCIRHNLYTHGNNTDYNRMLDLVDYSEPTLEMIIVIANDILKHSEDNQTLENIMYLLSNESIETFYEFNM